MRQFSGLLVALLLAAAFGLGATEAGAASAPPAGSAATGVDWPTYGDSLPRTGENAGETTLTSANAGSLHQLWSYNLGAVVDTSPVEAAGVTTRLGVRDLVFAGSEHGLFVALDAHTGALVWSRALPSVLTTCTDMPDKVFGITAAPAIDRAADRIYVAAAGKLFALRLGTGFNVGGWPVQLSTNPSHEHVYGGLSLYNGTVYAELAGMCDITPYRGRVVAVSIATRGLVATFYTDGVTGPSGGGIWGWGGAAIDPASGALYVSTGNALATPENLAYAEDVLRLDSTLAVVAADKPPNTHKDQDFGSTPVLFQAAGCPAQVAVEKKGGLLFLYNADSISSGPVQLTQLISPYGPYFIGMAAWSNTYQRLFVADPQSTAPYTHGMLAFSDTAPGCTLTLAWQTPAGLTNGVVGSPTVAADVVYYGDGGGNQLHAFNALTGTELWNSGTAITGAANAAPIVVNGILYAAAWDDALHAFGP